MKKKDKVMFIDAQLNRLYPEPEPPLHFDSVYQLLVAVILSAQCTDERVNIVTKDLFADASGPHEILALGEEKLKGYIRTCGLFNSKAKNIIKMTADLLEHHDGEVPREFDELVKLAGVGNKTAGVVVAQAFGTPAFPVDTHIERLAHRLGLTKAKTADKISADLKKLFPIERWADLHLQIIFHGRQVCPARKPRCGECELLEVCPEGKRSLKRLDK
ncbi:MAG: endonuclease III [Candidatus Gracilibacteria bacterium]|nr:endonuclease III [Candidatus Gracilibacteria bacterium]